MQEELNIQRPVTHRFIDELGDTTFYGKGKQVILGQEGVSPVFGMCIVKFLDVLDRIRSQVVDLQKQVENDPLFNTIPSVAKRIKNGGFFFHASKDTDDVRAVFLRYLREVKCEAEVIVARKIPSLFVRKHHGQDDEFYADVLSHLIKSRLKQPHRIVLTIAKRGSSTRNRVLHEGLNKAYGRAAKRWESDQLNAEVKFNVQTPLSEPLLAVPDYLGWAVHRVFERGQTRYYDYLLNQIRLVVDLYDTKKYTGNRNYYDHKNPLTAQNKISPSST